MNEQEKTDKGFLKDKLGDYRVDPPAQVWTSISARLGRGKRRRMIIISLSAAATIALAVVLGINFVEWNSGEQYTPSEVPASREPASREPAFRELADRPEPAGQPEPAESNPMNEAPASREPADQPESEDRSEALARHDEAVTRPEEDVIRSEALARSEALVRTEESGVQPDAAVARAEPMARAQTSELAESMEGTILMDQEELQFDVPPGSEQGGRDPKWMVGAALSPLYSYRDAEEQLLAVSNDYERGIISYAGGIHVSYRTGDRLAIESGVLFNKMGIAISAPGVQVFKRSFDFAPLRDETGTSNILAVSNSMGNIVSQSGDIYVNSYKANQFYELNSSAVAEEVYADQGIRQNFDYLELPFNVRYSVIKRELEVQLVGGMSTNFLLHSNVTMPTAEGNLEIGYLTNLKTVNYSGNAGVGMIYHLQEHFSLRLEPRFRYFLNSINDQTLPATRPFTFGIYTGLNYRF